MKIPTVQLALDCSSTEEAIRDCQTGVVDEVDILECGYSLIAAEGARVVKIFREMYPNKPLLADLKIVDAGSKIGGMLLDGRPISQRSYAPASQARLLLFRQKRKSAD